MLLVSNLFYYYRDRTIFPGSPLTVDQRAYLPPGLAFVPGLLAWHFRIFLRWHFLAFEQGVHQWGARRLQKGVAPNRPPLTVTAGELNFACGYHSVAHDLNENVR